MNLSEEAGFKDKMPQVYSSLKPGKGLAELFGRISSTYELINHLLTFGYDYYWRCKAARIAGYYQGSTWLDMCTGTGDMARALARCAHHSIKILAVDFCWPMLSKLKKRRNSRSSIFPILAQAAYLPFKANSIDLITLAFANRNLFSTPENLFRCWQEFHRILKPGGLYLNLETSQPHHPLLRRAFHFYVRKIVRPVGQLISGDGAAYSYLSTSIARFLGADDLKTLLYKAGFSRVEVLPLSGGIVAIHLAFK